MTTTPDHAAAASIEVSRILNGIMRADREAIEEMFAKHLTAATAEKDAEIERLKQTIEMMQSNGGHL